MWPFKNKSKEQRRRVKDVKPGECIYVEYYGIWRLRCLNNDPVAKKIFLEDNINQKYIFKYNGRELKNFNLLNNVIPETVKEINSSDISYLQKQMNDALEKEDYEIADRLQKQIDKLSRGK